jgi:hydroxypyruvate isomerase
VHRDGKCSFPFDGAPINVPGRHEIDDRQELNYPTIVRAIAATGYKGYIAHEFIPRGAPIEALQQAVALCDV